MKIFIQNETGSFVKNSHNEKTLELIGSARVSRPYQFPYGFILDTTADDGLNVDCFVLTKSLLRTGQMVECELVGLMEQIEDGKEDHKVLAVIRGEQEHLDRRTERILVEFVSHVFDHFPSKTIRAGEFHGRKAALDYANQHRDSTTALIE